jgi:4'-phosphopantetheinyl transferase
MAEDLAAAAAEIHLWLAFDDRLRDAPVLRRFEASMSADERQRWLRFRHEPSRLRHLIARGLQRETLSRYQPAIGAAQWVFDTVANGKPRIAAAQGIAGLHFNLSHTDGLTVLAVLRDAEVGIDAEHLERRAALEVAQNYFSPAEVAALEALPPARRHLRFYELWTLKESYLKATGAGLSTSLDRITFDFESHTAQLVDEPVAGWRFAQFHAGSAHLVALALRSQRLPSLRIRELDADGEPREWPDVTPRTFSSRDSGQEQGA